MITDRDQIFRTRCFPDQEGRAVIVLGNLAQFCDLGIDFIACDLVFDPMSRI